MTAEIAILNRQAVALAADSAVTVNVQSDREKIFVSANKVFSLSKYEPVGIMIYGSASFMQMPWETVIKDYRRKLGRRRLPHLTDYATNLLEFLRDAAHLTSDKSEDSHIRFNLYGYYKLIVSDIDALALDNGGVVPTRENLEKIAFNVIAKHHARWTKAPLVNGATDDSIGRIRSRIKPIIDKAYENIFENVPLSAPARELLEELSASLFARDVGGRPGCCGVVIAGFGEDDLYPSLRAYDVDGRVAGVLHAVEKATVDIGTETEATIIPFAQREVVDTFLGGVEPAYQSALENDFAQIINELPNLILSEITTLKNDEAAALKLRAEKSLREQFELYRKRLADFRREKFSNPIIQMVVALPKEELASMSEALVSLTSLRRRVSLESETVGGPIDVAVISKGDGLIWIKRKHYFKPELNQHFFATYYREPSNAGE